MNETQQELVELKGAQQALEGVQQELEKVQQENTGMQQELDRTQQELEGVQQELKEAKSEVQKLADKLSAEKGKCLEAHLANQKVTIYLGAHLSSLPYKLVGSAKLRSERGLFCLSVC